MAEGKRKTALETSQAAAADRNCATFVVHKDHILGNSLWYLIMKKPGVEFCGYTKTHPSEIKFNLLIQMQSILQPVSCFKEAW